MPAALLTLTLILHACRCNCHLFEPRGSQGRGWVHFSPPLQERGLWEEAAAQQEKAAQLKGTADEVQEGRAWEIYAHLNYYIVRTLPRIDLHYLTG